MQIGILYICTGKYAVFWEQFFLSCEQFILKNHIKHYFVFTDQSISPVNNRVHIIHQKRIGWPFDTLLRYHMFYEQYHELKKMDYLFFFNANMLPLQVIGDELLPLKEGLMAVLHPGFYDKPRTKFTYETNPESFAYIPPHEGSHYFMGGLNGGTADCFLELCGTLAENIENDLEKKIVAIWHDESHLNRYLTDRPVKILSPGYGYPEGWEIPFEKKIIILDKNKYGGHAYLREINSSNLQ